MGDASFVQTSFLGGEWSPLAQGRMELPAYRVAMNVCFNTIPLEEGASNRRSGTRFCATTRNGNPGRLIKFAPQQTTPYNVEFTDGHVRFFFGPLLVFGSDVATVTNISNANPAIVTVATPPSWNNGDQVGFLFQSAQATADCAILRNRQFVINFVAGQPDQFTLTDNISGQLVNGSQINWDATQISAQVARVTDLAAPWTNKSWQNNRMVQAETNAIILNNKTQPQVITITPSPGAPQFAPFTIAPAAFIDGPYLDPVPGSQLSVSALSGVISITVGYATWVNTTTYAQGAFVTFSGLDYMSLVGGNLNNTPSSSPTFWQQVNSGGAIGPNGFLSTDIGRQIRLFSEPLPWQPGTAYVPGNVVGFNGAYYTALVSSTGQEPDLFLQDWQINPSGAIWTWGTITSINSANSANVQLIGGNLLYTTTIFTWRIGVYSNTTGWPTCGTYHEGRLWLAGAVPNRFDGSNSNNIFVFSPTAIDGTVGDGNAVTGTANASDDNTLTWMKPTSQGILCGSLGGEWLIHASTLNDPITPTSIQFHRVTKYGSGFIEPVDIGFTTCFVQKQGRKILEALADVFSGRFSAPNLTRYAKHLTTSGIAELAYQEELAPILWARCNNGSLIGCTYRRVSAFASEDPVFFGWHRHTLGSGRLVESISAGPSIGGTLDNLSMVTNDPTTNIRHVEVMTDLFDANAPVTSSWFVDDAVTPSGCQVQTINGVQGVTFYGLWHLNGHIVSVSVGGLDCGDFLVTLGSVFVPFGSDSMGLFTQAYLTGLETNGVTYPFSTLINTVVTNQLPQNPSPATVQKIPPPTGQLNLANAGQPLVDLVNNVIYEVPKAPVNVATSMNIFTGAQISQAAMTVPLDNPGVEVMDNFATGSLYYRGNTGSVIEWVKLSKATMAQTAVAPMINGVSNITGMDAAQNAVTVFSGSTTFIVQLSPDGAGGGYQFSVMDADNLTFAGYVQFNLPPTGSPLSNAMVAGHQGVDYGEVFSASVGTSGIMYFRSIKIAGSEFLPITATNFPLFVAQGAIAPVVGTIGQLQANQWNPTAAPIAAWSSSTTYLPGTVVFDPSGVLPNQYYMSIALAGNLNKNPTGGGNPTFWVQYPMNPLITQQLRFTHVPTDFDPTASNAGIFSLGGLYIDQSDGNVILYLQINTGSFVAKMRPSDGLILWVTKFPSPVPIALAPNSRISGGLMGMMAGSTDGTGQYPIYMINTNNGALTTFHVGGVLNATANSVVFDATNGRVLTLASLISGSPGFPQVIPPSTLGWVAQWTVFQLGTIFFGSTTAISSGSIPAVIGFTYTSQGQLLRPASPAEAGSQNGPGFAKIKRQHWFGALVAAAVTGTISFGTTFQKLYPAAFKNVTVPLTSIQLFSGIYRDVSSDGYGLDSQGCWQVTRPVPAVIAALGGFINTQDL